MVSLKKKSVQKSKNLYEWEHWGWLYLQYTLIYDDNDNDNNNNNNNNNNNYLPGCFNTKCFEYLISIIRCAFISFNPGYGNNIPQVVPLHKELIMSRSFNTFFVYHSSIHANNTLKKYKNLIKKWQRQIRRFQKGVKNFAHCAKSWKEIWGKFNFEEGIKKINFEEEVEYERNVRFRDVCGTRV